MLALTLTSILLASCTSVAAEKAPTPTQLVKAAANTPHPWYVKALSDQIVNYCCIAGMFGGGGGGGGYQTVAPAGAASTISFSSLFTETYLTNTATTLYTTIPGSVVTIYGSPGQPDITTSYSAETYTSVVTPTPDAAGSDAGISSDVVSSTPIITSVPASTPTAKGLFKEVEMVESYAHALAEAVVAPVQMTKMLSSAYAAIMEHGYIHASQAVDLVSQASDAYDALRTDPAYSAQSERLAAQPTPINFKKAVAQATKSHTAGFARLLAEPSGKKVFSNAKELGEKFVKDFVQH